MTLVSMFSLLAYNCHFHDAFTQSPQGYMFHLLYYRSHHCDPFVDWSLMGIENVSSLVEPEMPHEIRTVTRTFWIAVVQVIFNGLLVITAAIMLGKVKSLRRSFNQLIILSASLASTKFYWLCKTRRLSYQLFFTPLLVIFLLTAFIDMSTSVFFSRDRFRSQVSY